LKPLNSISPLVAIGGFQRTYEELKRNCSPCFRIGGCVFSVPMRNWNQEKECKPAFCIQVFSVPMRNWNNTSWCRSQ